MPHDLPEPCEYSILDGPVGCLLLHGFTSSPGEFAPLIQYLREQHLSILAPLLPGHGTKPKDLNNYTPSDFVASAEKHLFKLKQHCSSVFVIGLSMGAGLSLSLASQHTFNGLILLSAGTRPKDWRIPFLPLLRHFFTTLPKSKHSINESYFSYSSTPVLCASKLLQFYRTLETLLPGITIPSLSFHSRTDPVFPISNCHRINETMPSTHKKLILLNNCGHVLTVEPEMKQYFPEILKFIKEYTP